MPNRTPKRIAQSALSASVTSRYIAGAGVTTQITEIWLVNTGSTDRSVTLYQGGITNENMIANGISVPANGMTLLQDLKIVVAAGQTLAAKQDAGTDVTMTAYGIEEV